MKFRVTSLLWFCTASSLLSGSVLAQEQQKGDGSIRIEYQYLHADKFYDDVAEYDYWSTDTQAVVISGDYALNDRWTVFASLPYVRKRFNSLVDWGGDPHNPADAWWIDFVPPDQRYWDDGEYHGSFQDFSVGASYLAIDGAFSLSPYVSFGTPASDYPFYAKAAIGANLWTVPVGASFSYVPYFSDWHFRGNVAYVFSEQPLGINVDYWLAHLSAGYWFKPDLSVNVFASLKAVREGLEMPWDFTDDPFYGNYPDEFDTETWWHHDRLIAHRNINVGIAADYFLNRKYKVSASWFTGVWTKQSNEIDKAFTMSVTRFFGGE